MVSVSPRSRPPGYTAWASEEERGGGKNQQIEEEMGQELILLK